MFSTRQLASFEPNRREKVEQKDKFFTEIENINGSSLAAIIETNSLGISIETNTVIRREEWVSYMDSWIVTDEKLIDREIEVNYFT